MTDGYLFFVSHPRDGSPPLHITYAVASADENGALIILEKKSLANLPGTVKKTRQLSTTEIDKLKLKSDECRSIWPTLEL
jgi:hypothetical protein